MDVEILGAPIIREADGLALSSRNRYLTDVERQAALALPRALDAGAKAVKAGERDPHRVIAQMKAVASENPAVQIDYMEALDARRLRRVERLEGETLLAGAIRAGSTRLIDNRELHLGGSGS